MAAYDVYICRTKVFNIGGCMDQCTKCKSRTEELEEALRFYADRENYVQTLFSLTKKCRSDVQVDEGAVARVALGEE